MSFLFHPVQYAIERSVNAVLKTPERGTRISGLTADGYDEQEALQTESLAFDPDRGFRPTFWTTVWKRPTNDLEAQTLYNHMRTLAWYADSLPLLSSKLPFNIGLDAVVGLIPGVGDLFGAIVGIYLVYIALLFGTPWRILGIMLALVALDTAVGIVPLVGDALDVAFKSNLYVLHLFEHHLTLARGNLASGQFRIVMPPSAVYWKKPGKKESRAAAIAALARLPPQPVDEAVASSSSTRLWSPVQTSGPRSVHGAQAPGDPSLSFRGTSSSAIAAGGADDAHSEAQRDTRLHRSSPGPVPGEHLPAMPLSLPSEFIATEAVQEQYAQRSNRQEETQALLDRPTSTSSHKRVSISDHEDCGYGGDEEEGNDDSDEDDSGSSAGVSMLFPDTAAPSPGRPRVGTAPRSRSRRPSTMTQGSLRRHRGVSWHIDTQGGYTSEDVDHSQRPSSLNRSSNSNFLLRGPISSPAARRRRYLMIYSAIFAIAYVTSLDANTGYLYLNFACSEFGALASFSTVAICQQMIFAIAKPPIAKLSDVFGRAEAFLFALSMYSAGYAIVSNAASLQSLIGGIVLQSAGNTGVQVLQSIVIADLTTAKWRGLVISLVNLPYLINFAVAGPLVDAVMQNWGWRVGYGMWSLIVPMAAAPLVIVLAVGQKQARSAGLLERRQIFGRGCGAAVAQLAIEIDALGLLLFTAAWTLLLGPLTLAGHGSSTPRELAFAIMAVGLALLGVFTWWEMRATNPIMPMRFVKNRAVVCISLIGILDFASFYLSWTYLSAFVQIVKDWGQTQTGYFATTQNVTSTIVGILIGSLMACTRRFKIFLVGGVVVRLIGVGLMIRYRNSHDPTFMLVLCQLLQGIGGGSVAITMQIAAQVCVRHADIAIVTALELLTTEIGAAMGSATAGLIFTTQLPDKLRENLPGFSDAELKEIYGSLSKVTSYPMGSWERMAIADAWTETMKQLCVVATLILIPTIPLGLLVPDFMLPDSHRRSHHHHHHHHRSSSHRTSIAASPRRSSGDYNGGNESRSPGKGAKATTEVLAKHAASVQDRKAQTAHSAVAVAAEGYVDGEYGKTYDDGDDDDDISRQTRGQRRAGAAEGRAEQERRSRSTERKPLRSRQQQQHQGEGKPTVDGRRRDDVGRGGVEADGSQQPYILDE